MENIVFKNKFLNITVGVILITLSILGYILGWVEDFLPLFVGIIIILLSLKRFVNSYKRIVSKNAALILIIELILDFVFAGLLIYLKDHVEVFVGLIIYIRGIAYLLINYIATRKIKLLQYIINIGYVTIGAFLMFYPLDSVSTMALLVSGLFLIIGIAYVHTGVDPFVKRREAKELIKKNEREQEKLVKRQEKDEDKIERLEMQATKIAQENKKTVEEAKLLQKEIDKTKEAIKPKVEQVPVQTPKPKLEEKTLLELRVIARERKLEGVSQLNKADLIKRIRAHNQK